MLRNSRVVPATPPSLVKLCARAAAVTIGALVSVGWLGFVGPLVVWLVHRDKNAFLRATSAGSFNFNLSMWLLNVVAWVCLFTVILIPVAIVLWILAAVLLVVLTRPLGPGTGPGAPTALPGATPYLVGSPTTGVQVGQLAPELAWLDDAGATVQLQDLYGNPVSLEDLRGKLVWLNFWATWCPPCQGETPVLRDLDEMVTHGQAEVMTEHRRTAERDEHAAGFRKRLQLWHGLLDRDAAQVSAILLGDLRGRGRAAAEATAASTATGAAPALSVPGAAN